jgi:chromosome segregation ATPase
MTDNSTLRDMVEDLQHELNQINSKLRSLAFDLKIEREVHEKTWAEKEALKAEVQRITELMWDQADKKDKAERQNEALRDIVRAAQLLVDLKHVTGNLTDETLANLTAALRSWYEPNGGGR